VNTKTYFNPLFLDGNQYYSYSIKSMRKASNGNNGNDSPLKIPLTRLNKNLSSNDKDNDDENNNNNGAVVKSNETMTVTILDPAQKRFEIPITDSSKSLWTVKRIKNEGYIVHGIEPSNQRLIRLGKLLTDDMTLAECGITVDSNDTGNVIHLFPKPNIVITRNGTNDQHPSSSCLRSTLSPTTESPTVTATAHVPQIHIDVSEASRTPAVTSPDIELARYRVRLLCFILLVYSAMHLLSLFTIFAFSYSNGDESEDDYNKSEPGDPTDTAVGESPFDTTGMVRPWFRGDTYDLFVSLAGFSAATLGLKATIRNISSLARLYFLALLIVGISWLFESLVGIDKNKKEDNSNSTDNEPFDSLDLDDDGNGLGNSSNDFYTNILFAILIPLLIWGLCFYRAWNYQHLLVEAENEARERHLSLLTGSNIGNNRNHGDISDLELQ